MITIADIVANLEPDPERYLVEARDPHHDDWQWVERTTLERALRIIARYAPPTCWRLTRLPDEVL